MKIFTKWGFTSASWRGQKGEYWVALQALLIFGFIFLPPIGVNFHPPARYAVGTVTALLGLAGFIVTLKALLDLKTNLTPLPYPVEDGQLVQTGVYRWVRHPIYFGLILLAASWAIWQLSLSHLVGVAVIFAFCNAKASREEAWLQEKYADYDDYRQTVKKLIPWVY